ncbi:hypothetical protein [[Phormidium] sp. ETS-05]|nr:hypothetical protein [[Phormidium] sp. ETS-05]
MIYLVDTNILIRFAHRHDPQHAIVLTRENSFASTISQCGYNQDYHHITD